MTAAASGLAQLLEQATPGKWEVDACDGTLDVRAPEHKTATIWVHLAGPWTMGADAHEDVKRRAMADARLIALAPDMARLLIDMAAFIRGDTPDDECDVPGCTDPWCCSHDAEALLVRFADLERNAT